jgi:hypothetical protein
VPNDIVLRGVLGIASANGTLSTEGMLGGGDLGVFEARVVE